MTEDELYLMSNKELREYCVYLQGKLKPIEDCDKERIKGLLDKYDKLHNLHVDTVRSNDKQISQLHYEKELNNQIIRNKNDLIKVLQEIGSESDTKISWYRFYSIAATVAFLFLLFVMFAAPYSRS